MFEHIIFKSLEERVSFKEKFEAYTAKFNKKEKAAFENILTLQMNQKNRKSHNVDVVRQKLQEKLFRRKYADW